MKRHRKHQGRERTRNEQGFVVRYTYPTSAGRRRTADFHTSDKAQAIRKAREYAERGWLISLSRHLRNGRWEDLPVPGLGQKPDRLTRTFAPTQVLREEVDAS